MKRKNTSTDILREFRELTKLVSEAADLSSSEMTKRPGRWEIFRSKMENGDPFILKTKKGDVSVTIPTESDKSASNEDLYNAVIENDPKAYKRAFSLGVVAFDSDENSFIIKSPANLRKDAAFGGKGEGFGTKAEAFQISQINDAIVGAQKEFAKTSAGQDRVKRMEDSDLPSIDIELGSYLAKDVVLCKSIPSTPKADATLLNSKGETVAFISLKSANSPLQMNQWSGISKFANEPEVIDFSKFLLTKNPNGVPTGVAYSAPIRQELKRKSAWGTGTTRSTDLVDAIIATKGSIKLKKSESNNSVYHFVVDGDRVWTDGEIPDGDWEPVLVARKGDRNDLGVPKTRIGIFPKGSRKSIDASKALPKEPPVDSKPIAPPPVPSPPPFAALGKRVTSETRLLLGELFSNEMTLEKYGLTEEYVTQVLGLPRPILTEGKVSEIEFRKIIREHLVFESWWDSAKKFVGSGVNAVKEKGESVAGVLKKYGNDSNAVVAALWSAASTPESLADLLKKFKAAVSSKSSEIASFLETLFEKVKRVKELAGSAAPLKKCIEFVKRAAGGILSLAGWKGMMASAGGYLGFEWIAEKLDPLKEKVSKLLKDSAIEMLSSIIQDEIVGFITNKITDIGNEFAASVVEQLAGPVAWLKITFTAFEKSSWVLDKLSAVISTSTNDFKEVETV